MNINGEVWILHENELFIYSDSVLWLHGRLGVELSQRWQIPKFGEEMGQCCTKTDSYQYEAVANQICHGTKEEHFFFTTKAGTI